MTAEKTGLAYRPPAQRVAFTFRHLLSQIQIIGRIDPALAASGVSATIRSVKLYGMPGTGECAVQPEGNGTWSLGEATDADNPFARDTCLSGTDARRNLRLRGRSAAVPPAGGRRLRAGDEYEYAGNGTSGTFAKSINLAGAGIGTWEAGCSYRYTFTVGNEYILFEKPEVIPWSSASGGNITVR